jgi:hypothetical protein
MVAMGQGVRYWVIGLAMTLLAGCSGALVQRQATLTVVPENETFYVVPFVSTLVPPAVSESVFNDLVDSLNDTRPITGVASYIILKDDLASMNQEWLARQVYLTGDIWSYQENSGCCATELSIKARMLLYQSGSKAPALTITIPQERFFEHDRSTIEKERVLLARNLAREMYLQLVGALKQQRP